MAIIIFTALARIDVRRHNIVSRFISNLSSLLPWSMMGRSCVLLGIETFIKWNFLFFTKFVKIFCDTTQPHSTTCTDGTRTSSLLINMSRIHLFYKLLWFNKSTASTIKMGNTDIQLGSAPFISLYWSQCSMFGHQYHYIQFSLSSVLIQQYFLQILRAIEIFIEIFNIPD